MLSRQLLPEGARVFLSGRTVATVEAVARGIASNGGVEEAAEVDALDEALIEKHLDSVVSKAGGIDTSSERAGTPSSRTVAVAISGWKRISRSSPAGRRKPQKKFT